MGSRGWCQVRVGGGGPSTDARLLLTNCIKAYPTSQSALAWRIAQGIASIFPSFSPSEWLTEEGVKRFELLQDLQGCNSVDLQLFNTLDQSVLVRPNWEDSWYLHSYRNLTSNGRKPISGPMLVLEGTADPAVNPNVTSAAVNNTCTMYPESQIQYALFEGATHVPVLNAGQQVWLKWIEDRFMGVEAGNGCESKYYRPLRDVGSYQKDLEFYLEIALEDYNVA